VEKVPYVIVYGDKESDESLAIREHGGEQTTLSLADLRANLATLDPWQAGAEPSLTS
jgi:threonyl-tRNA synthetase